MAALPVLTAAGEAAWEAPLVTAFETRRETGVAIVRRCVDLADLLAAASTGQARAVLLSAGLRRLDREALLRLAAAGLGVVALATPGDEEAERRLRQLGVLHVLPADAPADEVAQALLTSVQTLPDGQRERLDRLSFADPGAAHPHLPDLPPGDDDDPGAEPPGDRAPGRVVAVWGPTGAPGRTTVAVGLAAELAALGVRTMLVDLDVYGGAVAQLLGLLEEAPGVAAACRAANAGTLDVPSLAAFARDLGTGLTVLPGIVRPDRWTELRPSSVDVVLDLARLLADVVVVDCAFCLESDEELSFDTLAPRRNGATLTALDVADTVLVVGSADPVGLQRLVRGLSSLLEVAPEVRPQVVLNRVRTAKQHPELAQVVHRHSAREVQAFLPLDVEGADAAVASGRPLAQAVPGSPLRRELALLAGRLAGRPVVAARKGLLRR